MPRHQLTARRDTIGLCWAERGYDTLAESGAGWVIGGAGALAIWVMVAAVNWLLPVGAAI